MIEFSSWNQASLDILRCLSQHLDLHDLCQVHRLNQYYSRQFSSFVKLWNVNYENALYVENLQHLNSLLQGSFQQDSIVINQLKRSPCFKFITALRFDEDSGVNLLVNSSALQTLIFSLEFVTEVSICDDSSGETGRARIVLYNLHRFNKLTSVIILYPSVAEVQLLCNIPTLTSLEMGVLNDDVVNLIRVFGAGTVAVIKQLRLSGIECCSPELVQELARWFPTLESLVVECEDGEFASDADLMHICKLKHLQRLCPQGYGLSLKSGIFPLLQHYAAQPMHLSYLTQLDFTNLSYEQCDLVELYHQCKLPPLQCIRKLSLVSSYAEEFQVIPLLFPSCEFLKLKSDCRVVAARIANELDFFHLLASLAQLSTAHFDLRNHPCQDVIQFYQAFSELSNSAIDTKKPDVINLNLFLHNEACIRYAQNKLKLLDSSWQAVLADK
jgi:hypothetical protein